MELEHEGYRIVSAENPHYKQVKPLKQGSIPTVLSGLYTSTGEAMKAINLYKDGLKKVKANATKQSNG